MGCPKKDHVLFVDDDQDQCDLFAMLLEQLDCAVIATTSTAHATDHSERWSAGTSFMP